MQEQDNLFLFLVKAKLKKQKSEQLSVDVPASEAASPTINYTSSDI